VGIIGCECGGGCEWEVVVGVAGAVLRLEERLLRFSEGVSPASFFFLEPPDLELYGVSLLFAFPFFFLFRPPSYSKSESLSGSERSSCMA